MLVSRLARVRDTLKFFYAQRVTGLAPPDDRPLFDPESGRRFEVELSKASAYLEYGSGGSTVLVDSMGIPAVSVESDRFYAKAVKSRLRHDRVTLLTPDIGITREWGTPIFANSRKGLRYVDAPFPISPFPDFILVDGRFRVACALECARQAYLAHQQPMLMIDDYTYRPEYHRVEEELGVPEIVGRAAFFILGQAAISRESVETAASDKR